MDNRELFDLYNSQSNLNDGDGHTDYSDYTDYMEYDTYNPNCDYVEYDDTFSIDQDWGGTNGPDGYPDQCVSHDDYD